jgi:imidazolonepropionase-like amidohydrolase
MRQRSAALVLVTIWTIVYASIGGCAGSGDGTAFRVLVRGRLIDGTGADPVTDGAVVISGGRILYAGPRDAAEYPRGSEIIDVSGLTILPGFFNAHVHGALSTRNLEAWARAGVTTVRDLGCDEDRLAAFREAYPPEPGRARLVAAGPLITVPGGYPIVPFGGGVANVVTSEEDARQTGEALLDRGADLLKLALETGSVFGRTIPVLNLDEARVLVRVAHGRGTVVSAHITSAVDLDLAVDAGADDLAHMAVDRLLRPDEVDRVVAEGVYWVPTLELWACAGPLALAVDNLGRFVAGGGRVALGTDYQGYTCNWELGMPMTEIRLMAEAGMTPMQIIVAATLHGARVSNLEGQLGTLESGKIADLLVVDGDPLADLEDLQRVRLVVRDGVVIRDELSGRVPHAPRRVRDRRGGSTG